MKTGTVLDPNANDAYPWPANSYRTTDPDLGNCTYEGPSIAGQDMPGQWLLTSCKREFGWQQQMANFQSGAVMIPVGDPPMQLEYEVRIWEAGAMVAFTYICKTILQKAAVSVSGPVPISAALGIEDPILKILGVTNVVVAYVDFPKNPLVSSGGKGPWVGKVGFFEWKPVLSKASPPPNQTIPDQGALAPPASDSIVTASAAVTAGASKLQSAAASAYVPPR